MSVELDIPPHLSHSQVNSYKHCPRQYVLEKGLKIKGRPSWALMGGSAFHEATEEFDRALFEGTEMDDELLKEAFDLALESNIQRASGESGYAPADFRASGRASKQYPNKEDGQWWIENGHAMCLRWKNWRRTSPWDILVIPDDDGVAQPAIELEFVVTLGDGIIVKGAIDNVFTWNGVNVVLDKKTGKPPQSDDQLALYRLAMRQAYGVECDSGAYWMSREGGTTNPVDLTTHTLEQVEYDFTMTRKAIDARLFPAKPSNMCSSCPVRDWCYSRNGSKAHEVPLSFSD